MILPYYSSLPTTAPKASKHSYVTISHKKSYLSTLPKLYSIPGTFAPLTITPTSNNMYKRSSFPHPSPPNPLWTPSVLSTFPPADASRVSYLHPLLAMHL